MTGLTFNESALPFLDAIKKQNLAVIINDLQYDYCSPDGAAAHELGWNISPLEDVCRRTADFLPLLRNVLPPERILWVVMEEDWTNPPPGMLRHTEGPALRMCTRGTKGHEFHLVQPAAGEPVFLKNHFSVFTNPRFKHYLEEQKIEVLTHSGVLTSRCMLSNIISGSVEGYRSIFLEDLSANPVNLEAEAVAARHTIGLFYARAMQSGDFLNMFRSTVITPQPAAKLS